MKKSTNFEKNTKKEFYSLIEELRVFNSKRWQVPFFKLSIDFYYAESDIQAHFNYPLGCVYVNTFHQKSMNIRYVLVHEITHFLICCSFDNSRQLFTKNEMYKLHSKHTLFFSVYNDILNIIFKACSFDDLLTAYNYHEDPDFEKINQHLNRLDYYNALKNFGEKIGDYYDLFLTSIYIYNYLKIGEIVPLNNQTQGFEVIDIN